MGSRRRTLLMGMALGLAGAAVAELVRPRPGTRATILDWARIRELALATRDEPPPPASGWARQQPAYTRTARDLLPHILEFTRFSLPSDRATSVRMLDRAGWIEINCALVQRLLEPVEQMQRGIPNSLLATAGQGLTTQYVGRLLGFLSKRVMGQYDPRLLGREPLLAGDLFIVGPNVVAFRDRLGLPERPLRQWLVLHEMTHAVEFEANPWLRTHLESHLARLLEVIPRTPLHPRAVFETVAGTRRQWAMVMQLQATMALLEGYSDLVMEEVGRRRVESFDTLTQAFSGRFRERSPLERLIYRLTGLEMKAQQYQRGDRFCRAVFEAGGMQLVNRAFAGPEFLPTMEEIDAPRRWLERAGQAPG